MAKHQVIASITKSIFDTDAPAAAPSFPVEISSMTVPPKREIAFIDRGVDDLETLLKASAPMSNRSCSPMMNQHRDRWRERFRAGKGSSTLFTSLHMDDLVKWRSGLGYCRSKI
ncbi:hypothetical protein V1289_000475 [Bradyrhizobium sp. AZCC 2289]